MCKNQRDIHFTAHYAKMPKRQNSISEPFSSSFIDIDAPMIFQRRASSTPASASRRDRPDASHYNSESDITNVALEEPVAMPPITEASEQPDFLALLLEASTDSDRPLQKLHTRENLRTRDIQALGRLERVDTQSHDAYLCEARLRQFGAQRKRVPKMQSSYFLVLSTQDDT